MKLEKAIELLKQDLDDPGSVDYNDRAAAQELGIEALKYVLEIRGLGHVFTIPPLPGETED